MYVRANKSRFGLSEADSSSPWDFVSALIKPAGDIVRAEHGLPPAPESASGDEAGSTSKKPAEDQAAAPSVSIPLVVGIVGAAIAALLFMGRKKASPLP